MLGYSVSLVQTRQRSIQRRLETRLAGAGEQIQQQHENDYLE